MDACNKKGVVPKKFTQPEATWAPVTGMTTELLGAEGKLFKNFYLIVYW